MKKFVISSAPASALAEEIQTIWGECFPSPDSAADAEIFCTASNAEALLLSMDGVAVGMCGLIPVGAGELLGRYLFAVGVRPAFRGMGGFRMLCRTAEARARAEKTDFLCLVPANEALDATYRRFGYSGSVRVPRWEISARQAEKMIPVPCFPTPRAADGRTLMPSAGFISCLRRSYQKFRLGDSLLLCGKSSGVGRTVYEYIPGEREECPPASVELKAHGLILPLTSSAERLCGEGISFYCSMGED